MFKNIFLQSFYELRNERPTTSSSLRRDPFPLRSLAMERVVEYMLKIQKSPSNRLPRIAWEASKKIQKTNKSKILCSSSMQYLETMVWNFKMKCNTLASCFITRFPCKQGLFAMKMYRDIGKTWRLILHALYYICCI